MENSIAKKTFSGKLKTGYGKLCTLCFISEIVFCEQMGVEWVAANIFYPDKLILSSTGQLSTTIGNDQQS